MGINVNSQMGAIDWAQVKQSGVDFALIPLGWRGKTNGNIVLDSNFQANIEGALAAESPSLQGCHHRGGQAEATLALEQIRNYQVTWPIAFFWTDTNDDRRNPPAPSPATASR